MFANATSFTLNSCTMNEVSGNQTNHHEETADHRSNCDNQNTRHITSSYNNYVYDDDEILADDSLDSKPPAGQAKGPTNLRKANDLDTLNMPQDRYHDLNIQSSTQGATTYLRYDIQDDHCLSQSSKRLDQGNIPDNGPVSIHDSEDTQNWGGLTQGSTIEGTSLQSRMSVSNTDEEDQAGDDTEEL